LRQGGRQWKGNESERRIVHLLFATGEGQRKHEGGCKIPHVTAPSNLVWTCKNHTPPHLPIMCGDARNTRPAPTNLVWRCNTRHRTYEFFVETQNKMRHRTCQTCVEMQKSHATASTSIVYGNETRTVLCGCVWFMWISKNHTPPHLPILCGDANTTRHRTYQFCVEIAEKMEKVEEMSREKVEEILREAVQEMSREAKCNFWSVQSSCHSGSRDRHPGRRVHQVQGIYVDAGQSNHEPGWEAKP
jgi:hypothetical protein